MSLTRAMKVCALTSLHVAFCCTAATADMMQSFHASKAGRLQMWRTVDGDRVPQQDSPPFFDNSNIRPSFTERWTDRGNKDRDLSFFPRASSNSHQREAFFDDGMMLDWDLFWDAQPLGFEVKWPVLADPADVMDIYAAVDLTVWVNSQVPFAFGDVIPIVNGRNDTLLPGYLLSTSPAVYVPGVGWAVSDPLNGTVTIGYERDGTTVPEPATLLLFSSGLAGVGALLRRRKHTTG